MVSDPDQTIAPPAPPNGAAAPPLLLTADELGQLLGFGLRTIRRHDDLGKVPQAVQIGRAKRWRREEVIAWTRAGCPPRDEWTWHPVGE